MSAAWTSRSTSLERSPLDRAGDAADAAADAAAATAGAAELDERLASLAAAHAPLRRALARIAARLVATRGWERLGFARLRDYAVERLGVSDRQVHELARGDAVLSRLPQSEAAFLAGRITWTKVRLLGRVAQPQDEPLWLAAAERLSAEALAREVRAVDGRALERGGGLEDGPADEEARETVFVRCAPSTRGRWAVARQLAQRMAGEKLPPWACAEAVAAEVLSASGLETGVETGLDAGLEVGFEAGLKTEFETRLDTSPETGLNETGPEVGAEPETVDPAPQAPTPRAGAAPARPQLGTRSSSCASAGVSPPLPPSRFLSSLVRDLESADVFELDARFRRAMRLARRHEAELARPLLALAETRLFLDLGFRSFDAYVRERLGMAPSKARALLRLERIGRHSAPFRAAWHRGALSWTRAQALAPLLASAGSRRWHGAWVERARRVSVRRLEDDVELATVSGTLDPSLLPALPAGLQIGARPRARGRESRIFFTAPRDVARLFRAVLASQQRRIERAAGRTASESEAFHSMLEHAIATWLACRLADRSRKSRYAVFERDGWRCTVPGCTSYRNLHDHHIVFRAAGGSDELANRTTLCAWHHLRALHAGRIRCAGQAPGALRWELGLRRGRRPLVAYAAGDELRPGAPPPAR